MTTSSNVDVMEAVKTALKEIVKPWEMLCGFTDIGIGYIPDIYAKTEEEANEHMDQYMDAPTLMIDKDSGEIIEYPWDDENMNDAIRTGKYIKIQEKPKYARE